LGRAGVQINTGQKGSSSLFLAGTRLLQTGLGQLNLAIGRKRTLNQRI
jgi:hypothetical protein